jgi:hypothetical protein
VKANHRHSFSAIRQFVRLPALQICQRSFRLSKAKLLLYSAPIMVRIAYLKRNAENLMLSTKFPKKHFEDVPIHEQKLIVYVNLGFYSVATTGKLTCSL